MDGTTDNGPEIRTPRPHLHWAADGPVAAAKLRGLLPDIDDSDGLEQSAETSLDSRTAALIATAVAVALECDECVAEHAWGAAMSGAGEEEVAEAAALAMLMRGGVAQAHPAVAGVFREQARRPGTWSETR
jgi:AhpD family alkylhydroperoxidase